VNVRKARTALRIPIGRHCHVVVLRAAIDPRGIELDTLEQPGPAGMPMAGLSMSCCFRRLLALHLRLLHSRIRRLAFADRGRRETDILSNGITTGDVTNDAIAARHGPCSITGLAPRTPPSSALYFGALRFSSDAWRAAAHNLLLRKLRLTDLALSAAPMLGRFTGWESLVSLSGR
jgi:hypothetical protein